MPGDMATLQCKKMKGSRGAERPILLAERQAPDGLGVRWRRSR
jgi:hypothetical protein